MQQITNSQILCIFDDDNDKTPIFDKDEWNLQQSTLSKKQISQQQNLEADKEMIEKISHQIQKSKENFFKVKICQNKTKNDQFNEIKNKNYQVKLPSLGKYKNSILKEGLVEKKTDGFFFKWHKRHMVLTAQKLYFFQSSAKIQVIGCVNLKLLPAKIIDKNDQIIIDFMGQCENIIVMLQKKEERQSWKNILKQVVDFQSKQNKIMIKTLVKPIYDSKDTILQRQFLATAQTGDILLFYTKNTGAKIQRVITNSDFDHVAMVIKFRKNQLMVFESNQMYGVSIYDWKQYISYFDLYQKVTLRKLNYVKKCDAQGQLLNFVKKNIGKSYEINMNKLITLESDVNWDFINKQKNNNRGYFCSQLIAKALKSVGLLDQKKSSGRYWPVDFSEKNGLLLKKGAYLDREKTVLLNKHMKNYV